MISSFHVLNKESGTSFLVGYLKESHRLMMKAVSGKPEECSTTPRVATRRGLPLIIPGALRLRIEAKETSIITLVLSILTIYRILHVPGVLKLNTITDKFSGILPTIPKVFIQTGLKRLRCYGYALIPSKELLSTVKAGPNSKIAVQGLTLDAYAFRENPWLLEKFEAVSRHTGPEIFDLLKSEISNLTSWTKSLNHKDKSILSNLKLGRLAQKEEAAGKIRIFAITDI